MKWLWSYRRRLLQLLGWLFVAAVLKQVYNGWHLNTRHMGKLSVQVQEGPGELEKVLQSGRLLVDLRQEVPDKVIVEQSQRKHVDPSGASTSACNEQTSSRDDLNPLLEQMGNNWHWQFISKRITQMWAHWKDAAKALCKDKGKCSRHKKRVLVIPGVLTATHFARPEVIQSGGPLGDLVQWADLIAGIYVLGHDVRVEYEIHRASFNLPANAKLVEGADCMTVPDIIYVDISVLKRLPIPQREALKCRWRVVDAFGTQAMFNDPVYARSHGYENGWAMFSLNLKQYLTFYPHTPDNSFLGFAVVEAKGPSKPKRNMGVVYGKEAHYLRGKAPYLEALLKHMELVANVRPRAAVYLPPEVVNFGVLPPEQHHDTLLSAKFLVGLGDPLESTGIMEALSKGCIILNPKFTGPDTRKLNGKPTTRLVSSQVPYMEEFVGPPRVITLDISNLTEVDTLVKQAQNTTVEPWLPYEFSPLGFLERLNTYIEKQDFCSPKPEPWPPLSVMQLTKGKSDQSCTQICKQAGLVCEPSHFPAINNASAFEKLAVQCRGVSNETDLINPAVLAKNNSCVLQNNRLLYSCAGSAKYAERICPCRHFTKYQIALCDGC